LAESARFRFRRRGLSCGASRLGARSRRETQAWFEYEIRYGITEKLRLSWNLGYRDLVSTEDVLGDWSRLHLQTAVVYAFSRRVSFEGGAGGYYTFREKPADPIEHNSCDAVPGNPIAE